MSIEKTKVVDFVPEYNQDFDFKKVSDFDFLKQNSSLLPIFNMICMEKGSNQLYPDMGVKDLFMSIPYQEEEEVRATLVKIETSLKEYVENNILVTLDDTTDFSTGECFIKIEVEGVREPLTVHSNKNGLFNVHKSSLYKK